MKEEEWLACVDPQRLVRFLSDRRPPASARKLRLFACACCWRLAPRFKHAANAAALAVAECLADRQATEEEVQKARRALQQSWGPPEPYSPALHGTPTLEGWAVAWALLPREENAQRAALNAPLMAARAIGQEAEVRSQALLLRDLFGNPFRPITLDPAWLSADVRILARAAYDTRTPPGNTLDPARLAVLADALEEAGCAEAALLDHLRGPGPHVRGCFAVDWLLERP
jgi:hypothetical protein